MGIWGLENRTGVWTYAICVGGLGFESTLPPPDDVWISHIYITLSSDYISLGLTMCDLSLVAVLKMMHVSECM